MNEQIKQKLKFQLKKYIENDSNKAENKISEIALENKFENETKFNENLLKYLENIGITNQPIAENLTIKQFNYENLNYFLLFSNQQFIGFISTLIRGAKIDIENIQIQYSTFYTGLALIKELKNILNQNSNIHFINFEHKLEIFELKQLFEIENFKIMGEFMQYQK